MLRGQIYLSIYVFFFHFHLHLSSLMIVFFNLLTHIILNLFDYIYA
jgi:hypothetical protein